MNTLLQPGCGQGLSRTSSWCSLMCFYRRDQGPECLGLADTPGHSTCLLPQALLSTLLSPEEQIPALWACPASPTSPRAGALTFMPSAPRYTAVQPW